MHHSHCLIGLIIPAFLSHININEVIKIIYHQDKVGLQYQDGTHCYVKIDEASLLSDLFVLTNLRNTSMIKAAIAVLIMYMLWLRTSEFSFVNLLV